MPVTVPPSTLLTIATPTSTQPTLAARLDRLQAYCVDWNCGFDPGVAEWRDSKGNPRQVRFVPGAWVTPKRDSGLADIGQPHLVVQAQLLYYMEPTFNATGSRLDGAYRDMRIVKLVTSGTVMGPQASWVESIDFEPYVAPAGVTLPDVKSLLAPFVDSGTVQPAAFRSPADALL